jgi:hypothetical protein
MDHPPRRNPREKLQGFLKRQHALLSMFRRILAKRFGDC